MNQTTSALLLDAQTILNCPRCQQPFTLQEGFAQQALASVEAASERSLAALRESARADAARQAVQLAAEKTALAEREVAQLRALLAEQAERHERALAEVRKLTEASLQPQLRELREQLLADRAEAQRRLDAKNAELAALREQQLTLLKERQKLQDEKAAIELQVRQQVEALLTEREALARAQERERSELRIAELQKQLGDVSRQLAETQRKVNPGSQQLQGEVLELALEELLAREFPLDVIEEVKKGVRGGDVIQRVQTRTGQTAGVILWETKRAKEFNAQWVQKLQDDMRACGADVGVLVTMPGVVPSQFPDGAPFWPIDGVWVTLWPHALPLAKVLQRYVLDVHKQRVVSAGKGEKMEAVYDYVTSAQFALKLRGLYDMLRKQRAELEAEKSQTLQRWARREKQLDSGVAALLAIGGDLQGLAHESLPQLELGGDPTGDSESVQSAPPDRGAA
ncbi:MAG: DUF2130 domain-containing protein [Steroidobacteraceae bacterium]|nr:DUF2130 domain-containing protein [Steroidobacteraceae bacterium]MDW8258424.1 DUF2130 domain-containing protein [Gammaproteobacteria bacterium]